MKPITFILVSILTVGLVAAVPTPLDGPGVNPRGTSIRLLTYNVRYDSKPDEITVQQSIASLPKGLPVEPSPFYNNPTERPWSERRIGVANDILFSEVDLFGAQEVLKRQVDDLQELLGDEWGHIGVGRDDGKEAGEYSAIFFLRSSFELVSWDTFWLSNTPFEPSKFPGAGSFRACTRAQFKSSSGVFTLLNSHLDDQSDDQRKLGASLMLHRAKYEAIKTGRPVLLTGDFNSPTDGADGGAYKIATGAQTSVPINGTFKARYSWSKREEKDFVLKDAAVQTPPRYRSGNFATFTGFKGVGDTSAYTRIDYILGGSVKAEWGADSYQVGTTLYDNGLWHSDHRPVYSDIWMRN